MSLYIIKPLEDRSGFKGKPKPSQFKTRDGWSSKPVSFDVTRELLRRELGHLHGKNAILEVDALPGAIRLDGELYANAKVRTPAVRLHFDSKHGHLTYATDAFDRWQDNVRAIALALEALRKVDRYEVGQGGDQYRGYLALEAGSGSTALGAEPAMTERDAEVILGKWSGEHAWLSTDNEKVWRRARANAHPDRNSGDRTGWDEVERAAKFFGLTT
jgi:hypothetical protein